MLVIYNTTHSGSGGGKLFILLLTLVLGVVRTLRCISEQSWASGGTVHRGDPVETPPPFFFLSPLSQTVEANVTVSSRNAKTINLFEIFQSTRLVLQITDDLW